jgi:hypothetical protein
MDTDFLNVVYQFPGIVAFQLGMGSTLATAPLVKQNYPPLVGVKELPVNSINATTRPSVKKNNGFAVRVTDFLNVQSMTLGNGQIDRPIRLDGRIQLPHRV